MRRGPGTAATVPSPQNGRLRRPDSIRNIEIRDTAQGLQAELSVDPRLVFLACAGARHRMVEAGVMELDRAFGELIEPFHSLVNAPCCDMCGVSPCSNRTMCNAMRRELRKRGWR
jgi:hypothetical protein